MLVRNKQSHRVKGSPLFLVQRSVSRKIFFFLAFRKPYCLEITISTVKDHLRFIIYMNVHFPRQIQQQCITERESANFCKRQAVNTLDFGVNWSLLTLLSPAVQARKPSQNPYPIEGGSVPVKLDFQRKAAGWVSPQPSLISLRCRR